MRRFTIYTVAAMMTLAAVTTAQAQQRGRQGAAASASTHSTQQSATPSRGSSSQALRPSSGSGSKPSATTSGQSQYRPGASTGSHITATPGANTKPPQQQGSAATKPSTNPRPGGVSNPQQRPGNNGGYHDGHQPTHQPGQQPVGPGARPPQHDYGHGHGHGYPPQPPRYHGPDYHHHVPFFGHWQRPMPPTGWIYHSGGPMFGTILGVTLGTALNISLNTLMHNGYAVTSYGNDVIYLSNVPQMNYYWPDAALYYQGGMLYGSQFTYATTYYDTSRYFNLYNNLSRQYGPPVQMMNQGTSMSASWFGAGGRYVTLTFGPQYGQFYTTLAFGL